MPEPISTGAWLAGTLGSAALGGIGSALGISSQRSANEENMRLNRELLEFQKYQYEDQKRYNSMAEQVRRIRAANLNPALMMQGGNVGSSVSSVGSPSPTPMQPLDIASVFQPLSQMAGTAIEGIGSFARASKDVADANKSIAETGYQNIQNKYADDNFKWTVDNKKALSYLQGSQGEINLLNAEFLKKSLGSRLMEQDWQTELTRANAGISLIAQSYADQEHQANIKNLLQTAYAAVLTGRASVKQATASVMNAVTNRDNSHAEYGFDDKDRQDFFEDVMDTMDTAAELNQSNSYKNLLTPWSGGASVAWGLGTGHVEKYESHDSNYQNWKKSRLQERGKRRNARREARRNPPYKDLNK